MLLLAVVLGALALGAFASLNPGAPTWMRTLSAAEGLLLSRQVQAGVLQAGELRGFLEASLSALAVFLAAWPRPGRPATLPEQPFSEPSSAQGGPPPPGRP
jgi:hypothetical protein